MRVSRVQALKSKLSARFRDIQVKDRRSCRVYIIVEIRPGRRGPVRMHA